MTPQVLVGIGNTSIKLGVTRSDLSTTVTPAWSHRLEFPTSEFDPESIADSLTAESHCWKVASVQRAAEQRIRQWIARSRPDDSYRLFTYCDLPLSIDVEHPERVGMDRLAAAVAVNLLRDPDRPAVVVDAGTAITVNLITQDSVFRGGVILPGFKLTTQALAAGTDALPLIVTDLNADPPPVVGRSTEEAIRSGLFWGMVGAVRELVARMSAELPCTPQLFVTGGDARRLAAFLAADAIYNPDLVLIGIAAVDNGK